MKRILAIIFILACIAPMASADAFSSWSAYGDAFKATNDTYTAVMWNTSGTYSWLTTGNTTSAEYLMVGGGAAGGSGVGGGTGTGGGGGGGVVSGNTTILNGTVTVVIGAGGTAPATGSGLKGGNGYNTTFIGYTAYGGGGGGGGSAPYAGNNSLASGGGAAYTGTAGTGGAQGHNGGAGATSGVYGGGGGGGSSYVGTAGTASVGGAGGNGTDSYILITNFSVGGGGGGGALGGTAGLGGYGGGGKGNTTAGFRGVNGTDGTGGGGGGGGTGTGGGGWGGSGTVIVVYASPSTVLPIEANFTQSTNPSSAGQAVTFTDTSTGSPTTWNWTLSGTSPTNTTQNAAYTYTTAGAYTIFLNVTNATGSWSNTSQTHTVTNASGFTPEDIWMEGQYLQTFRITDSSTGLPITTVDLTLSPGGSTYTTTNGTGYLTAGFGAYTVTFISEGYVGKTISYVFDSDATWDVQMVAAGAPTVPNTNLVFSPRLVRLRAVDNWRTPLTPVTITAYYIEDTLPNHDPVYLQNAFGISADAVSLMMNSSVAMSGVTGIDGSNTFSMFPALTYNITVTNETMGVHCQQNLAPADTDYVLYCPTDAQKAVVVPLSQTLNRSYIWITEPNASYVTINASYQDPDGLTSSVLFNVTVVDNNTVIYSKNFGNPGTSQVLDNYTMPNIRGMQIKSYLAYDRSTP